ncbi:MAG: laminin B domain-containing protein [Planctomycetota bacterium]|nr:laminin B domain-containing protein [Planctomycetota bacterium]
MNKSMLTGLLAVAGLAAVASGDVINSSFDGGDEGWVVSDGANQAEESVSGTPVFYPADGNDGGFISAPIDWGTQSFLVAPAPFLGDQADKFGGAVEVDRRHIDPRFSVDPLQFDYDVDVTLSGAGMTLAIGLDPVSLDAWESFSISLDEAGGWFHLDTNVAATDAEILAVLGDMTDLRVRGNINDRINSIGVDNVMLVPTPGSIALLAFAGLAAGRRRR